MTVRWNLTQNEEKNHKSLKSKHSEHILDFDLNMVHLNKIGLLTRQTNWDEIINRYAYVGSKSCHVEKLQVAEEVIEDRNRMGRHVDMWRMIWRDLHLRVEISFLRNRDNNLFFRFPNTTRWNLCSNKALI